MNRAGGGRDEMQKRGEEREHVAGSRHHSHEAGSLSRAFEELAPGFVNAECSGAKACKAEISVGFCRYGGVAAVRNLIFSHTAQANKRDRWRKKECLRLAVLLHILEFSLWPTRAGFGPAKRKHFGTWMMARVSLPFCSHGTLPALWIRPACLLSLSLSFFFCAKMLTSRLFSSYSISILVTLLASSISRFLAYQIFSRCAPEEEHTCPRCCET